MAVSSRAITFRRHQSSPSFSTPLSIRSPRSLTHSLPLFNLLRVSNFFFIFLYFSLLFENSSYSFEAYFLCVAGCGEEVGLGGCGLLSCACVRDRAREKQREREERGRVIQPYDLIHSSFWLESDRERESESYSLGRVYALSQI